jgi:carboxypeptidase family protein/TonB-dependent receptor-like protein
MIGSPSRRNSSERILWAVMSLLFMIGASAVWAQLPTAVILGAVKDSSGGVIPEATLTARNVATGQTRTAVTAADGSYRFPALPVGTYELRVEHAGFQTEVRKDITLAVAQEAVVNFSLQVGTIEQTVSVTAELPLVNTTSGSLGGLVSQERVADLPLNGRNYMDLTLLQPGIQQNKNINSQAGMTGVWFSSNGAPMRSNTFLLDGALMQSLMGTSTASVSNSTLGIEGIREWRVITNSFTAEYGLSMGSQTLMVTKSGTNQLHGSLFEYLRNSALDARNFFDRKPPAICPDESKCRRLPVFTRNNFGGSVGGPIKKDKTFFFAVYEGLRERLGTTQFLFTIPAASRTGAVNPFIRPILDLYPSPNLGTNQFTWSFSQPTREDYGQTRIDHTVSDNDSFFVRYTMDDTAQTKPILFPQFRVDATSRNQYTTASESHVFSASLLNTFRVSFSRTNLLYLSPSGLIGPQYSFVPGFEIGNITIGGVSPFGPDSPSPFSGKQNIFTYSDDMFLTRGRHSFKFGTLINHYQQYMLVSSTARGNASFADIPSFLAGAASVIGPAVTPGSFLPRTYHYNTVGFYLQDDLRVKSNFTLNLGLRYEFATQIEETKGHGSAVRDIQHDAAGTLGVPFKNPSLRNLSPRFGFAWDVMGNGKTAVRGGFSLLYDISNFGSGLISASTATPPFSNRSTVTPATPGATLGPTPGTLAFTLPFSFPPAAAGKSPRLIDYNLQQPHILQYNLTVERQLPFDTAVTIAYAGSRGINLMKVTEGNPTVPLGTNVNGVCAPAGPNPDINRAGYCWLGNEPRTSPFWTNIDFRTAGSNSWYNSFQLSLLKRLSRGLQFQSAYTFSKIIDETQGQLGLNAEDNSNYTAPTDPTHRNVDRGVASFDLTHNWRFNTIYNLPNHSSGGAAAKALLNGWWMSGILSLQSGYPFSSVLQLNRSNSKVGGAQGDRPDLVLGRNNGNITSGTSTGCIVVNNQGVPQGIAAGTKLGTPDLYFDPCAFAIQAADFLGTAGRNILRGPGFATLDFSLVKDTPLHVLGEAGKLEFRTEFFNILNRANFTTPGVGQSGGNAAGVVYAGNPATLAAGQTQPPLSTAGKLTSTSSTSRQIQFALKLLF